MIKKYLYLMIFVLAIIFNGNAQTYSSVIDDSTILEFIEWKIEKDTAVRQTSMNANFVLSKEILKWKDYEINFDSAKALTKDAFMCFRNVRTAWLDTIFSKHDYVFIIKQKNNEKATEWKHSQFHDSVNKLRHFINIPLFSSDKKFVL